MITLFTLVVLVSVISINDVSAELSDTDGDGISDSIDQCPTQAETVNGNDDSDGCPDVVPPNNLGINTEDGINIPFVSQGETTYANFSIKNVTIVENEFYNVIFFDVKISVKGSFGIDDTLYVHPLDTFIQNISDEVYSPDIDECKMTYLVDFSGKYGNNHEYQVCFSVEKEDKKFYVFYWFPTDDTYYQIGTIILENTNKSLAIQDVKIPNWVKNTMRWYIDGSISENEMILAIQFLVKSGIIKLN